MRFSFSLTADHNVCVRQDILAIRNECNWEATRYFSLCSFSSWALTKVMWASSIICSGASSIIYSSCSQLSNRHENTVLSSPLQTNVELQSWQIADLLAVQVCSEKFSCQLGFCLQTWWEQSRTNQELLLIRNYCYSYASWFAYRTLLQQVVLRISGTRWSTVWRISRILWLSNYSCTSLNDPANLAHDS